MKIIEFDLIITQKNKSYNCISESFKSWKYRTPRDNLENRENHKIPNEIYENHENHKIQCDKKPNHENPRTPLENHENHDFLFLNNVRIMQIMKILEFLERINEIMKIIKFTVRITKIIKII